MNAPPRFDNDQVRSVCGHLKVSHIDFSPAGDCGFWGCFTCQQAGESHRHFFIPTASATIAPEIERAQPHRHRFGGIL